MGSDWSHVFDLGSTSFSGLAHQITNFRYKRALFAFQNPQKLFFLLYAQDLIPRTYRV